MNNKYCKNISDNFFKADLKCLKYQGLLYSCMIEKTTGHGL